MVPPFHTGRQFAARLLSALAAVCVFAAPAAASAIADFNGDGIVDSVQLSPSPEGGMIVRVSGAPIQVLRSTGIVVSLAAADLDHDGDSDLGVLSQHGLEIWLNTDGRGRFAALETPQIPHGVALQEGSSHSVSENSERHDGEGGYDGKTRGLSLAPDPAVVAPLPVRPGSTWVSAHATRGHRGSQSPRAPPSSL